jgi:hypothetical protein
MAKQSRNPVSCGRKKCNICGIIKPVSEYFRYRKNYRGGCKSCNYKKNKEIRDSKTPQQRSVYWKKFWSKKENRDRKYKATKKRLERIKQQSVDYLGGKCSVCGYGKCIKALEFHHKDPKIKEKSLNNGAINRRRSFLSNKKELDKCVLLCSNCHREAHYNG